MLGSIPKGYQQLTNLSAATGLTVPSGARFVLLRAEGADVRWRDDGTDPTATVGQLLKAGDTIAFEYGGNLQAIKFVQAAAGAILNASYYRT